MLSDGLNKLLTTAVAAILATRVTPANQKATSGVFLVQLPEAEPAPAIVLSQIAGETDFSLDGPSDLRFVRWQFTCYGRTPILAKQLQRAVRQALEAFTGELSDGSAIESMECVLETDAFQYAPSLFTAPLDMHISFHDSGN